ncbi:MAG: SDR family oxidoreductase [Chloroflexi bacterium]|jgi:NAD(P)-dependent dehydrogenase (short-subunit alcohol dehydrogenase family)|nr:SDR family oxidoreductase [Chloroflexota bacterium]
MTKPMNGKVALVTGGSSGIGKATVLAFAEEGAKVVIASRTPATGEQVARTIREAGGAAMWVETDVTQAAQVEALVQRTLDAYGRLDYAFNNAGSGGAGGWITEIEEADWDATIDGYLDAEQGMLLHQPIGRLGEPEEVAHAVVWLCSDQASLITGTAMPVDGGYLMV